MLKNILNLNGTQQLSKNELIEISGGKKLYKGTCELAEGGASIVCPEGTVCVDTQHGPQCIEVLNP